MSHPPVIWSPSPANFEYVGKKEKGEGKEEGGKGEGKRRARGRKKEGKEKGGKERRKKGEVRGKEEEERDGKGKTERTQGWRQRGDRGLQPPRRGGLAPPSGKNDDFVGEHWGKKKIL